MFKSFSKPAFPGVLLAFSILLTIIAWYISHNHLTEKTQERFEYRVGNIQSAIEVRMSAYEQVLRSAVGFFHASDTVMRSDWKRYVQTLQLEKFYPGILGLGYTARIPAGHLQQFIQQVRAEGFPDFIVWPDTPRQEYFSIVYLEPFEGRNLRAFGFDMFTEQKRKQAMLRAWTTGEPALTEMVTLVQETTRDIQKGCLLYLPVYNLKMPMETAEQRMAALRGFIYSPFRMRDLMKGIIGEELEEVEYEVYDGRRTDTSNLFYSSHGYNESKSAADFSSSRIVNIAGNDWTLVFTSREPIVSAFEANQPNIIAIAGVIVNLLLLLVLLKIHSLSRRNRILAEGYKAEKDRYEIISESTSDIIWEWDLRSNRVRFNKNYQQVLGHEFSALEMPYKEWIDHLHPDDKERVVNKMQALISSDRNFWSDEYRLLRADGTAIHILDRGRLLNDKSGNPVRMVGSMIDITVRKQAEESQKRFSEELERTVKARTMELQRSNEDLERFAHVTSHDLKEPVRKILTSIDLLKIRYKDKLGDGVAQLDKLSKSAGRLHQMIDSILIFSTLNYEAHGAERVELDAVIDHVRDDLELVIAEKQASIHVAPLPVVEGSRVLLHQLFYNLLNNALKFTRDGIKPVIHIDATRVQDQERELVEIRMQDNGIGFEEEEAEKIFQSFVRLHSKDQYEGTGLGLALCKRIVERHGGNMEATGSPGAGATFIVRLPLHQREGIL